MTTLSVRRQEPKAGFPPLRITINSMDALFGGHRRKLRMQNLEESPMMKPFWLP